MKIFQTTMVARDSSVSGHVRRVVQRPRNRYNRYILRVMVVTMSSQDLAEQFVVTIRFRAKPGRAAILEKHLRDRVPISRTEAGTLDYRLYRSTTDENLFFLFSRYASEKSWDLHLYQPYTISMMAGLEDLMDGPPKVETYRTVLG